MLREADVVATVAVKDIVAGKKFYGDTLGLKQTSENPAGVNYQSGSSNLFMYMSDTAGSGRATCAWWGVDDVGATVAELKGKGITFEHYELPGVTMQGDVHVMGPMKAAWFKDPDGNVLSIGNKT
mgnify:CR=1 FL=1